MIDTKITSQDLETLIEAMGDWESTGNHEFHIMNAVKNAILPAEENESYEFVKQVKDHFAKREKQIKADRSVRQEKAIFLKAKLMWHKSQGGIQQIFEDARQPVAQPLSASEEEAMLFPGLETTETKPQNVDMSSAAAKLKLAERFIEECGIRTHYEKFLADEQTSVAE